MSFVSYFCDKLLLPEMRGVDMDSPERLAIHKKILSKKPLMQTVFKEFYILCKNLDDKYFTTQSSKIVELGAGSSPVKNYYPSVLTSDLVKAPNLDLQVDAQNMPFEDGEMRSIWGVNCFHHFPDPRKFFNELERVLAPGGGCIIIDPYFGPFAARFYKDMCETEDFDVTQKEWSDPKRTAMSGANQALTYIIFNRDKKKFNVEYPNLEIVYAKPMTNYLRYLLCGGVNFVQLIPNWLGPIVRFVELLIYPFIKIFALHHVVVLRKKN